MVGAGLFALVINPGELGDLAENDISLPIALAVGVSTAAWAVLVGFGLQATDSVTAAIVVSVEPVFVAVLAFLLLDESLSAREIVGGLVVLAALATVSVTVPREA